jgi:hypothetical protein
MARIFVDGELLDQFNRIALESGRTRNALIHEALREWLGLRRPSQWPSEVLRFGGIKRTARFEEGRETLKRARDPFE